MAHGSYLPIVVFVALDGKESGHATSCLYLPVRHAHKVTWHSVFVDTSTMSQHERYQHVYTLYRTAEREAFDLFRESGSLLTHDDHVELVTTDTCIRNIQKKFSTCAPWSCLLALYLLKSLQRQTDVHPHVSKVCQNLSTYVRSTTIMTKFLDMFREWYRKLCSFVHKTLQAAYQDVGVVNMVERYVQLVQQPTLNQTVLRDFEQNMSRTLNEVYYWFQLPPEPVDEGSPDIWYDLTE